MTYSRRNQRKMEQMLEARELRETVVPFGRCRGARLCDITIEDLVWIQRHARSAKLRRAVAHAIETYGQPTSDKATG